MAASYPSIRVCELGHGRKPTRPVWCCSNRQNGQERPVARPSNLGFFNRFLWQFTLRTIGTFAMSQESKMICASEMFATPLDLYRSISRVWSGDTSSPAEVWSQSNPAQNHCSITSLVVQDYFGGEILTTKTSGGTHFYNLIDGKKWDLTFRQFAEPVPYDDTPSSRDAALADTSEQKYALLTTRLKQYTQTGEVSS